MTASGNQLLFSGLARKLAAEGLLNEADIQQALRQALTEQIPFVVYLIKHKLVNAKDIAMAAAQDFGIPLFDLDAYDRHALPQLSINNEIFQKHHALPLFKRGEQLFVAISDPTNQTALDEIKFHSKLNTSPILVEEDKLQRLLEQIASHTAELETSMPVNTYRDEFANKDTSLEKFAAAKADAPIVQLVQQILLEAVKKNASDIHFEPYESSFRIRLRQDGILYTVDTPPLELANRIVSCIKVMAELDIAERRLPQDGRFKLNLNKNRSVDLRVSTCPTVGGEKAVIRILDPSNTYLDIEALGYEPEQKEAFLKAIHRPQGMVLVTGPTGSGKTVSLYTAINIRNTTEVNICTVEDPIELNITGINQVQINPKANLSFAAVLRAFLRQDPDIIMVGEMRDLETVEIGIKAAQTGHLVLSTLHTNSAAETLSRIANMGVAPFNIATSVILIIAQRLARILCNHCKRKEFIPEETLLAEGFKHHEIKQLNIYGPTGCEKCAGGYKGRTGIYEVLPITEEISHAIMQGANSFEIAAIAEQQGVINLRESGLQKVRLGITSLEEINRITRD